MPLAEDVKSILRQIGLSAHETSVYTALLESGELTAMEVSQRADVPYSKVYAVLKSLKAEGWIKSTDGRPARYYPVAPVEALATAKLRFEDRYKSWEQTIAAELQPLYEKRGLVEHPEILILHGQQGVIAKLEETLGKARTEVMIAAPAFAKTIIGSAAAFLGLLQKSRVNVKLMVAGKHGESEGLVELTSVAELRVRDHMFGGGVIVDAKEAMLFLGEDRPSLVIWSNHLGLVSFAKDYFQFLWDSSKPVS